MKSAALVTVFTLLIFGFGLNGLAAGEGTKLVATMTQPERGEMIYSPFQAVSYDRLMPGKPVVAYLRRIPEPTLAAAALRGEKPGRSTGTKTFVLFQKGR
jgi:hypothetical protein